MYTYEQYVYIYIYVYIWAVCIYMCVCNIFFALGNLKLSLWPVQMSMNSIAVKKKKLIRDGRNQGLCECHKRWWLTSKLAFWMPHQRWVRCQLYVHWASKKLCAKPAHNAGGYSFSCDVRHVPSSHCPIDLATERFAVTCQPRRILGMAGKFSKSNAVGFRLIAPHNPCASSMRRNSGHLQRYWRTKRCHTLASELSLGGAGCSIAPTPPWTAKWMSISMVKSKSRFPMCNCSSSRKASAARPHRQSRSRTILGARRCREMEEKLKVLPRAWDHVSHGGPANKPMTARSRIPCSQKSRTGLRDTSPNSASIMMSNDTVKTFQMRSKWSWKHRLWIGRGQISFKSELPGLAKGCKAAEALPESPILAFLAAADSSLEASAGRTLMFSRFVTTLSIPCLMTPAVSIFIPSSSPSEITSVALSKTALSCLEWSSFKSPFPPSPGPCCWSPPRNLSISQCSAPGRKTIARGASVVPVAQSAIWHALGSPLRQRSAHSWRWSLVWWSLRWAARCPLVWWESLASWALSPDSVIDSRLAHWKR